jgi:hypothetical protein
MELARMAMSELRKHEAICTERYEQIAQNQQNNKEDRNRQHTENQSALYAIHVRVDRLYNRAWAIVGAVVGIETLAIVAVIAWAVNKTAGG